MRLHRKTKVALFSKLFLDSLSKYKLEVMHERFRVQIYLCVSFYLCKASEAKNYTQIKYQSDKLKLFSL